MAVMNVNPTRMELTNLKKRLITSRRGYKLLKDKRDEMMKKFLNIVRENRELREKVEKLIEDANKSFVVARAMMSDAAMEQALMYPSQEVDLDINVKNIMSVEIPEFEFSFKNNDESSMYPYGYAATSVQLDVSIEALSKVLPDMLRIAQMEKSAQLLATEIEKTRRRVNALEYVLIPNLTDTIRHITMKLEENERGNLTRLMKVKDMMIEEKYQAKHR